MKNKILITSIIAIIVIVIIIAVGLSILLDEKNKFVGTWQYSTGESLGTITFNNDNTVNINDIGPLADLELTGVFDYSIANNQVSFTSSGSFGVTLNYSFPDSNTLILSNDAGLSITLIKA